MTVTLGHLLFQLPATIKSNLRLYESLNFKSIKTHHGIIFNYIYIYMFHNNYLRTEMYHSSQEAGGWSVLPPGVLLGVVREGRELVAGGARPPSSCLHLLQQAGHLQTAVLPLAHSLATYDQLLDQLDQQQVTSCTKLVMYLHIHS